MKTLSELTRMVAEMRQAQRAYFQTRSTGWLTHSKKIEKEVDTAIKELLNGQQTLFDTEEPTENKARE